MNLNFILKNYRSPPSATPVLQKQNILDILSIEWYISTHISAFLVISY